METLERYLMERELRGSSPRYLALERKILRLLHEWLGERPLNADAVNAWLVACKARGVKPSTLRCYGRWRAATCATLHGADLQWTTRRMSPSPAPSAQFAPR